MTDRRESGDGHATAAGLGLRAAARVHDVPRIPAAPLRHAVNGSPLIRLLALTFAMLPCATPAQDAPLLDAAALDEAAGRQQVLIERIEAVQRASGPLTAELIDPLRALAVFYEESGDDILADATRDRVLQLIRANYGLYSLEQLPLLTLLFERAAARGDHAAAWGLEQQMIEIARRNADDLRAVDIRRGVGDRRLELLENFIAGEHLPQIQYGCYYAPPGLEAVRGCTAGSLTVAAAAILNEAHDSYFTAIEILQRIDPESDEAVRAIEMDIVRSSYYFGKYLGIEGCERALAALDRLHDVAVSGGAALADRVASLVIAADYRLVCSGKWIAEALNMYEVALNTLIAEDAPQSLIDRFFAPDVPIDLPTFIESSLDVQPEEPSAPFVDVQFELSRFGTTRNVRLLDREHKRAASSILTRVRKGRFRPIARDGEFVHTSPFVVRYYLDTDTAATRAPGDSAASPDGATG